MMPRVLLIDNEDSFTWNLVQMLKVSRACSYRVSGVHDTSPGMAENFDKIIFSPGPGVPAEKPLMKLILDRYSRSKSILGICLGHQAIAEAFGAKLVNLQEVVHGIRQELHILEPGEKLFRGITPPVSVGLYHSWAVDGENIPSCLKITAVNAQGTIMAISHAAYDVKGLQFHPESFMTDQGTAIISNWLAD